MEKLIIEEFKRDSRYTFDNYIKGDENKAAYEIGKLVANNGCKYNPIYIHGNEGKTHLLLAIANDYILKNPNSKVLCLNGDGLMSIYCNYLKVKKYYSFRQQIKEFDLLIIDVVDFISKSTKLAEEVLFIFDDLYQQNKQIILSGSVPPNEIKNIKKELSDRFSSGVVVKISDLGYETKLEILNRHNNKQIPKELIQKLASLNNQNTRGSLGAIIKQNAYLSINKNEEDDYKQITKFIEERENAYY